MAARRTAMVPAVVTLLALTGCGARAAPQTGPPSQNSDQVPGTRPSSPVAPTARGTGATSHASAAAEDTLTPLALTDLATGDFVAGLGPDRLTILEIGLHGVGKSWNTERASV
jgi:hypothetical protein